MCKTGKGFWCATFRVKRRGTLEDINILCTKVDARTMRVPTTYSITYMPRFVDHCRDVDLRGHFIVITNRNFRVREVDNTVVKLTGALRVFQSGTVQSLLFFRQANLT